MVNRYIIRTILISFLFLTDAGANVFKIKNDTLTILLEGKKEIIKVVSNSEKNLMDKIVIDVPIDAAPVRVRAFNDNNKQKIEVSTGYSVIANMIARGYMLEKHFGKAGFGKKYTKYTARTYATGRIDGGKSPSKVAGLSLSQSKQFSSNNTVGQEIMNLHAQVLWFVLAHEIAHHVLNHRYGPDIPRKILRKQEKEADDWASKVFIKLGLPPASGLMAHFYWYYLDEFGLQDEYLKTHPPELRRMKSMVVWTLKHFDEWNDNISLVGQLPKEEAINAYNMALIELDDKIYEQTDFKQVLLNSELYKACKRIKLKACLNECVNKWGHPESACKADYCNGEKTQRRSTIYCYDLAELNL